MTNEEWFDAEIDPALKALAERCAERGMAFTAVVELEPGGTRGEVSISPENTGLAMVWLRLLAKTGNNIDRFMVGVARYCREHHIDTGATIVLRHLTGEKLT